MVDRPVNSRTNTISIDLDGVLADQVTPVIRRLPAKFLQLTKDDITHWAMPIGQTSIDVEIERALLEEAFVLDMVPIPGAISAVGNLWEQFKVSIATGRSKVALSWTKAWLDKHEFQYDQLIGTTTGNKILRGSDLLIDDYLGNINSFIRKGPSGRTAILFEQPWNSDVSSIEDLLDNGAVVTARDWEAITDIVEARF